jgi:hypothetical protein
VKDLVDMALLVDAAAIDGASLSRTLREVFRRRATHDVPAALPKPPPGWRGPYARLAAGLPIPQSADDAHRSVAAALKSALALAGRLLP